MNVPRDICKTLWEAGPPLIQKLSCQICGCCNHILTYDNFRKATAHNKDCAWVQMGLILAGPGEVTEQHLLEAVDLVREFNRRFGRHQKP